MVRDPGNLREDDPHVVATLRNRDPNELLHGHAVAHVVDERRNVVEPVGVGNDTVVVDRLRHFLKAAVEVADLHFSLLDALSVKLGLDPDDPMHGRVRGADVEKHISRLEIRGVALRCQVRLDGHGQTRITCYRQSSQTVRFCGGTTKNAKSAKKIVQPGTGTRRLSWFLSRNSHNVAQAFQAAGLRGSPKREFCSRFVVVATVSAFCWPWAFRRDLPPHDHRKQRGDRGYQYRDIRGGALA